MHKWVLGLVMLVTLAWASEKDQKDDEGGCCGCKIKVSEPKAYDGKNCPVGLVATGVASIRPPQVNCVKITCACEEEKE